MSFPFFFAEKIFCAKSPNNNKNKKQSSNSKVASRLSNSRIRVGRMQCSRLSVSYRITVSMHITENTWRIGYRWRFSVLVISNIDHILFYFLLF